MNKREAKLRALKLCVYCLEQDFAGDGVFDMVDEDTPDDEALRIGHEAREFMKSLYKRIHRLEAAQQSVQSDICPRCKGAGQYADYIGKRVCSLCNGTGKCR